MNFGFRYNVIVKGFSGKKITKGLAFILVIVLWVYSTCRDQLMYMMM